MEQEKSNDAFALRTNLLDTKADPSLRSEGLNIWGVNAMSDETLSTTDHQETPQSPRREFLYLAAGTVGAVGAAIATWPLIDSLNPSAEVLAVSSVELDLSPIQVGQRVTVKWRGQSISIDHRAAEQIARAKADDDADLRDPEKDSARVQKDEWLIVIGICTHLGFVPLGQSARDERGEWGGWYCPCHGSHYKTSGRIRKGPAPRNLDVPKYAFLDNRMVRIG